MEPRGKDFYQNEIIHTVGNREVDLSGGPPFRLYRLERQNRGPLPKFRQNLGSGP